MHRAIWVFLPISLLWTFPLAANTLDHFHERFSYIRDEKGAVEKIVDNTYKYDQVMGPGALLRESVTFLKLYRHHRGIRAGTKVEQLPKKIRSYLSGLKVKREQDYRELSKSLLNLYASAEFEQGGMLASLENVLGAVDDHLYAFHRKGSLYPNATVAHLKKPLFFYKDQIPRELFKGLLNLVRTIIPKSPWETLINHVVKKTIFWMKERRAYVQNILLFYLQNYPHQALKLTRTEKDQAISSILSAEIKWYQLGTLRKAKKDWIGFGRGRARDRASKAQKRLEKHRHRYLQVGHAYSDIFRPAIKKRGQVQILNTLDKNHLLTSRPSAIYHFQKPHKVFYKRLFFELLELGLKLSPASAVNTVINPFLKSNYKNQVKREGALIGYFERQKRERMVDRILRQSLNPFLYQRKPSNTPLKSSPIPGEMLSPLRKLFL